jgi:hypothetical protein
MVPGSTCITFPISSIGSYLAMALEKWSAVYAIRARQNQIFPAEKRQWTSALIPLNSPHLMKCETTNSILTFALGALILLDVLFAVRTINCTREFRSLQYQAVQDQATLTQIQQILSICNDTAAYNQKTPSPELTRILQAARTNPVKK